jgi:uncharacterized membrane protein YfcA
MDVSAMGVTGGAPVFIAVIVLAFLAGGLVKGVVGMGLPTVSLAVLGTALGLHEALPLMVVPSFVTNVWQAAMGGRLIGLARRFWLLLALSAAGAWAGVGILVSSDARLMNAALGVTLCIYSVIGLTSVRIMVPARWGAGRGGSWLDAPVGAATGLISGMTGTIVMPVVLYLEALDLDKETLVQAMGLSFSVSTLALGLALASHQAYDAQQFIASALALAPSAIGMAIGQILRQRISAAAFRRWLFGALLLLGLNLASRIAIW